MSSTASAGCALELRALTFCVEDRLSLMVCDYWDRCAVMCGDVRWTALWTRSGTSSFQGRCCSSRREGGLAPLSPRSHSAFVIHVVLILCRVPEFDLVFSYYSVKSFVLRKEHASRLGGNQRCTRVCEACGSCRSAAHPRARRVVVNTRARRGNHNSLLTRQNLEQRSATGPPVHLIKSESSSRSPPHSSQTSRAQAETPEVST